MYLGDGNSWKSGTSTRSEAKILGQLGSWTRPKALFEEDLQGNSRKVARGARAEKMGDLAPGKPGKSWIWPMTYGLWPMVGSPAGQSPGSSLLSNLFG